ncbi:MAG: PAS domain-containing sensor histidine kinase [Armatimonadetes bacterium]|nr:PAS domain-containing sensor histidine kinase [Armatimonadota bacterium]
MSSDDSVRAANPQPEQILLPSSAAARIFAISSDGIVVMDSNLQVTAVNPVALHMAGIEDVASFEQTPLGTEVGQVLRQAIRHGIDLSRDVTLGPVSSEQRSGVSGITARAVVLDDGGSIAILQDRRQELEMLQRHRQCSADVAHDLRAPLTGIQGCAEALLDGSAQDPKTNEHYLKLILDQCHRMSALLADVLDFSALAEDCVDLHFKRVDLAVVVSETVELFERTAADRGISLQFCVGDDAAAARGDARRIRQALTNLVSNAIGFSPSASSVDIRVFRRVDHAVLEVRDSGPGLSESELERVWQRYYRVKSLEHTHAGTGLGLPIVKRIAELHGGRAGAESSPGKGSAFWFSVPRCV